jgi:hypothetical protein
MAKKLTNYDLRNQKYDVNILEQNINNLSLTILVNTQKLTPEFCVKYILNEDYMDCEEEKYLLTDGYVLSRQRHITQKDLDKAYDNM